MNDVELTTHTDPYGNEWVTVGDLSYETIVVRWVDFQQYLIEIHRCLGQRWRLALYENIDYGKGGKYWYVTSLPEDTFYKGIPTEAENLSEAIYTWLKDFTEETAREKKYKNGPKEDRERDLIAETTQSIINEIMDMEKEDEQIFESPAEPKTRKERGLSFPSSVLDDLFEEELLELEEE